MLSSTASQLTNDQRQPEPRLLRWLLDAVRMSALIRHTTEEADGPQVEAQGGKSIGSSVRVRTSDRQLRTWSRGSCAIWRGHRQAKVVYSRPALRRSARLSSPVALCPRQAPCGPHRVRRPSSSAAARQLLGVPTAVGRADSCWTCRQLLD